MDQSSTLSRWSYYRTIESDLDRTFEYVRMDDEQLKVYSDRFARIILAASAEAHDIMLQMYQQLTPVDERKEKPTIQDFKPVIVAQFPKLPDVIVRLNGWKQLRLRPWYQWRNKVVYGDSETEGDAELDHPKWWSHGYNKIKHARQDCPEAASFKFAIESTAALMALINYASRLGGHEGPMVTVQQGPQLFTIMSPTTQFEDYGNMYMARLPGE